MEWKLRNSPDTDEEAEEKGRGGSWSRVGSTILARGWGIGKKIAIAGAAITSAPVVLPPLVIFSALGFAFAVPFGVFFAGYAATDKVMRSLLPPPPYPTLDEALEEEEEEAEALEDETLEEDEYLPEEEKETLEVEEDGLEGDIEMAEEERATEDGREVEKEGKEEEDLAAAAAAAAVAAVPVVPVVHELALEPSSLGAESESPSEPRVDTGYSSVTAVPEQREVEIEKPGLSSEYASAGEDHSSDTADAESGVSVEHGVETRPLGVQAVAAETEVAGLSDEEVLYSEEKVWEQIGAMRIIVGYKATLHSSCIEELRALYLFTGVEPPVSFKDTSDLVEVNAKLRFLKTVVGVK